jgi:hypothetical protein
MENYVVKPLGVDTWDSFVRLAERHNGVFGGCWCTWFHTFHADKTFTAEGNRALKERLVEEDRAHATLVFDGDEAVAWAQYGPPEELPNIHHRKEATVAGMRWTSEPKPSGGESILLARRGCADGGEASDDIPDRKRPVDLVRAGLPEERLDVAQMP